RARDRLAAQAIDPPSLVAVAADVGVAPVRLARTFRRAYGESPGEFPRPQRIRRACGPLAHPEASLAQVAAVLGFSGQSHFTRVFRRLVGITAGAWRRARK